jgi:hypothetical protein
MVPPGALEGVEAEGWVCSVVVSLFLHPVKKARLELRTSDRINDEILFIKLSRFSCTESALWHPFFRKR